MKIKIAFVTNQMIMGGIERSLVSLLRNIPKDKFDVTVFVMGLGGELLEQIPSEVKVEYLFGYEKTTFEKVWKYTKKRQFITAFNIGLYTLLLKKGAKSNFDENMYYSKMLPIGETEYDLAVAYYIPASLPVVYVMNNMKAKRKIAWLHSDIFESEKRILKYKKLYNKYDNIFGVSQRTVDEFGEVFPHLKDRTSVFYNILDKNNLELMSLKNRGFQDSFSGLRILTVGRLALEKGQDLIPKVLLKLISKGFNVRWYCIGDGELSTYLKQKIEQYRLKDHLILLGTKENPYAYIRNCDLYIQPSRHEAYCITVAEARVFNKPIITTDTGASEQIVHGETGLIVDFDSEQLVNAVSQLLSDEALRTTFKRNLSKQTVDTTKEINKFYTVAKTIS